MPTVHPQVQKARDLLPLIAAASAENDEIRELTRPVVKALIDGGFFTMLKTKPVGGMELKPSIFAQVTEAIASADGSTGWVVCQSNGCSTTSAYLAPHLAEEIFGRPDGIVAWGPPGSPYEATPADGGYRITGKWRFMSGSQNATWLGAHLRVAGERNEDVPLSEIERDLPRHLAHAWAARHSQQRIFRVRSVHPERTGHLSRRSARSPQR
jgi:alkylation response protein AidB-like acyl-CoA dehydrogenase